jgi:hypothetical protein
VFDGFVLTMEKDGAVKRWRWKKMALEKDGAVMTLQYIRWHCADSDLLDGTWL